MRGWILKQTSFWQDLLNKVGTKDWLDRRVDGYLTWVREGDRGLFDFRPLSQILFGPWVIRLCIRLARNKG